MPRPLPTLARVVPNTISNAISMILLLASLVFITTQNAHSQGTQVERRKGTTTAQYGFLEYLPPDYNVDPNKNFRPSYSFTASVKKETGQRIFTKSPSQVHHV